MPSNHVLLRRIELNDTTASVAMNNLPQTGYTDLKIVASVRGLNSNVYQYANITFNGSATGYSGRRLEGSGSSAVSYTGSSTAVAIGIGVGATATANTFGNAEIYIPNYTSTTTPKSVSSDMVGENNATAAYSILASDLWNNNAAITSIEIAAVNFNFVAGTSFSVYGIAALNVEPTSAPRASGGSIYADGTYYYHVFRGSGYFTPNKAIACDVLTVAGGGAGGMSSAAGGGAGAGGVFYAAGQSLTSGTQYAVTVGAGGSRGIGASGSYSYSTVPGNGNNSQFGSLTAAVGGGRGGGFSGSQDGGSGGGGYGGGGIGGSPTTGQGFRGGNGQAGSPYYSGAGGGAGGAGGDGTAGVIAVGGIGTSAYSSWGLATASGHNVSGTVYFAGGGGGSLNSSSGGAGGAGGGGAGAPGNKLPGTNGTANTGGGGGATANQEAVYTEGSFGGSGIVIVRYPMNA